MATNPILCKQKKTNVVNKLVKIYITCHRNASNIIYRNYY